VRPLNFAGRPFRNENLPRLAWGLAWTLLVVLTVGHALALRELLAGGMARRMSEVGALDRERTALRNEADSLRRVKAEADAVGRWRVLKGLVDQRMLAWTELLGSLEDALPSGVRLTSISPSSSEGRNRLDLLAVAFAMDDALELVKVLQARPEFSEVYPLSISETGRGLEIRCSMLYAPGKRRTQPVSAPTEEGAR
jgi:Tfp pilus assembly protein PilN